MRYTAKIKFIFEGTVEVEAQDKDQVKEYINDNLGLCIGGNIHTTMPDKDIDWNFEPHSEKVISNIRRT